MSEPRIVPIRVDREQRHTIHVGMVVFLGSWAMLFGALFFSYAMLRLRSTGWPRLPLLVPGLGTIALVASEVALARCAAAVRAARPRTAAPWAWATVGLGLVFLAVQADTWVAIWQGGLTIRSGVGGGFFFTFTVFHALHVLVGLGLLARWLPRVVRGPFDPDARTGLHLASLFWHFVGVVWVLMYLALYVI